MQIEHLFEHLETLNIEKLLTLADSTDVLLETETYDLVMLVQELAGRLEDILNDASDTPVVEPQVPVHEYNR